MEKAEQEDSPKTKQKSDEFIDLLQMALWAAGAAATVIVLVTLAHSQDVPFLAAMGGGLFLSLSLIIPRHSVFMASAFAALSSLMMMPLAPMLIRVAAFAVIINIPSRSRFDFPPFISVSIFWALCLLVSSLLASGDMIPIYNLDTLTLTQMMLEIGLSLFLGFILCIGGFPLGLVHNRTPSLSSFISHSCGLIGYGLVLTFVAVVAKLREVPLVVFVQQELLEPLPLLLILGILMMIPLVLALGIEYLFTSFNTILRKVVFSAENDLIDSGPPIAEIRLLFRDLTIFQLGQNEEMEFKDKLISQLDTGLLQSQESLRELRTATDYIRELSQNAPSGIALISAVGKLAYANEKFCDLLQLSLDECLSRPFHDLQSGNEFLPEVSALLQRATQENSAPLSERTPVHNDMYLTVCCKPLTTDHKGGSREEQTFQIFLTQHAAPNRFQIKALSPASIEIIGTRALELCKSTKEKCSEVLRDMHAIPDAVSILGNTNATREEQNEALLELSINFKKFEASLKEMAEELQNVLTNIQSSQPEADAESSATLNVREELQEGLDYLSEIMLLKEPLSMSFEDLSEQDFNIQCIPSEFTNFLTYLLGVMRNIIADYKTVKLVVGKEHIGSATANIILGSYPGDYLRILITHAGKSALGNLILRSSSDVTNTEAIENSLYLLTAQVKRLGGFSSVRSSINKGTEITIYIPQSESETIEKIFREEAEPETDKGNPSPSKIRETALLVGVDNDDLAKLSVMLGELGFEAGVRKPDTLLEDFNQPLDFSGSGFESSFTSEGLLSNTVTPETLEYYAQELERLELVVVVADSFNPKTSALLRQLQSHCARAKRIVLVEPTGSSPSVQPGWVVVEKPFDKIMIEGAINSASNG